MPPFLLTTSWDDGHILDERIVDLLNKYHLSGTFYISRDYVDPRLSESQIRTLSKQHEVGAHTLHHPNLAAIAIDDARHEILDSREWLQQVTGSEVTAFCYPRGVYTPPIRQVVAEAGFALARTTATYQFTASDRFAMPVSLQVYPFPLRPVDSVRARFQPLLKTIPHIAEFRLPLAALRSWPKLAEALLRRAAPLGGVLHIWGHSWEIDRYHMWPDFTQLLAIAGRYVQDGSAQAVTNTELAHILFDG